MFCDFGVVTGPISTMRITTISMTEGAVSLASDADVPTEPPVYARHQGATIKPFGIQTKNKTQRNKIRPIFRLPEETAALDPAQTLLRLEDYSDRVGSEVTFDPQNGKDSLSWRRTSRIFATECADFGPRKAVRQRIND